MAKNKNIVVIYHGGCPDGLGGAWAAWKKFGNKAVYFGAEERKKLPPGVKGREIYLIDFTYDSGLIKKLMKLAKKVTAIDHHVSAKNAVFMTENPSFSINHSGAILAWKYFHPEKKPPILLRHIEDFDLWRFKIPHTDEVAAFLDSRGLNLASLNKLVPMLESPVSRRKCYSEGRSVLAYQNEMVRKLVENNSELVRFVGYKALAVNSPELRSEIGHELANRRPPVGIVWYKKRGGIHVSLRSDGTVDVSKIAVRFGGGGHRPAAAFLVLPNAKLPWRRISGEK